MADRERSSAKGDQRDKPRRRDDNPESGDLSPPAEYGGYGSEGGGYGVQSSYASHGGYGSGGRETQEGGHGALTDDGSPDNSSDAGAEGDWRLSEGVQLRNAERPDRRGDSHGEAPVTQDTGSAGAGGTPGSGAGAVEGAGKGEGSDTASRGPGSSRGLAGRSVSSSSTAKPPKN
jgi:hypothetical protein